jgi:ribosomal-protein-alanine N-acetyltransferase
MTGNITLQSLIIDQARAEDLDGIAEIDRQSFPEPWSVGEYAQELARARARILVIRAAPSARPLAYIDYWLVADEIQLLKIGTAPPYRRQGLAAMLMRTMIDEGQAVGARLITLEVRDHNTPAIELYRQQGFCAIGRREAYYSNGDSALVMGRELR